MEKDNLKTLLDYLIFLQPQIEKLINMEDITMNQTELAELERLAEIGRATEKAVEKEYYFANPINDGKITKEDINELLDWAKED